MFFIFNSISFEKPRPMQAPPTRTDWKQRRVLSGSPATCTGGILDFATEKILLFLVGEEAIVAYRRVEFPVHWVRQKISRPGGG